MNEKKFNCKNYPCYSRCEQAKKRKYLICSYPTDFNLKYQSKKGADKLK